MAPTRHTIDLAAQAKAHTSATVDAYTYSLIRAWAGAWDDIHAAYEHELARLRKLGRFTDGMDTERIRQLERSMRRVVDRRLAELINETGAEVGATNRKIINDTVADMADVIGSQLPPGYDPNVIRPVPEETLSWVADRTTQQITVRNYFLEQEATAAMKRELFLGLAAGDNPVDAARRMIGRVENKFNGGLTRAVVIARTEMLDAHREAARQQRLANADILDGWIWLAQLEKRTCPSCWAQHGTRHPIDEPGPLDHHQGRCTAIPVTKTWEELGFHGIKETNQLPGPDDARKKFEALPEQDQLDILGPKRHEAYKAGNYPMNTWSQRVEHWDVDENGNPVKAWRDSYHVSPVPEPLPPIVVVPLAGDYRALDAQQDRAVRFMQDYFECGNIAKQAAQNLAAGRSALVGLEIPQDMHRYLLDDSHGYDLAALKNDITRSARWLVAQEPIACETPLFKGMSDIEELNLEVVFTSMTTDRMIAEQYRAMHEGSVILEVVDAEGIELPRVHFHQETLVSGSLELIEDSWRIDDQGERFRYLKARWRHADSGADS